MQEPLGIFSCLACEKMRQKALGNKLKGYVLGVKTLVGVKWNKNVDYA